MRKFTAAVGAALFMASPVGAADERQATEPRCLVTTGGTPLHPIREMVPCSKVEQSCYAYALGAPVQCSYRVRTEIIRP